MPHLPEIEAANEASASPEVSGHPPSHSDHPQTPVAESPLLKFEAIAALAIGIAFAVGVLLEQSPLNGSVRLTGWEWPWRSDLEILRCAVFLLAPFAMILYAVRRAERPAESNLSISLGALTIGNFLLQLMAMLAEPRGIELVRQIVLSPSATSYYLDSAGIHGLSVWLRHFDRATLGFHSSTHPPGPILFYYALSKWFGFQGGALAGGCAVGLVASLGVLAMYVFAGLWTDGRRTRLIASAFYALVPALTVFFPEMDQIYPIFSMLLILFWCKSLRSGRAISRDAIGFGAVLCVATFFAYNLLTIGAFLAYYGLYWLSRQKWAGKSLLKLLRNTGVAGAVFAGGYGALWLATGYDPIASFFNALSYQAVYAALLNRSYAISALFDPYDFLLGAGILALPLVIFLLYRTVKNFDFAQDGTALTLIAVATIATIDLSGVLRGEASRVWLFLQPLLIVPAAIELSRQRGRWLLALISLQWLILTCLKAKMTFIRP